jgi:hypothetical protein
VPPVIFICAYGSAEERISRTAQKVRELYKDYFSRQRSRIVLPHDRDDLLLTDNTIYSVVSEIWPYRVLGDKIDLLAKAFQTFRTSALKSGEGQYVTKLLPREIILLMREGPSKIGPNHFRELLELLET